ncbi:DHA1 family inner membrane transport protein [Actinoplanes octamycinicus]|uniref:DHA1 family inner membrane transport protein n=1 Tax=Actinoplanes octamycinicus TaxID=135948 RepID=A0A7W7H4B8_9ACTN|nr:MFS transporter [Actinoplanes octamycinicus]MBB4743579.1 DHA1 family inner membrane transport protein [Actinoplanes octamycinicus]
MPIALYALAIGGFGIGLTEFVIAGLLPEVAAEFQVTEAAAGGLISGYALAVAVGAILLTAALGRVDRRRALLALMVLFIAGNLLSAIAPTYGLMLLGRILAALCHGAFFGIGAVVAADLVPAERKAAAISTMFTGLTVANVLGVPLGTFLGQAAGWRATFWAIAAIGVLALIGIAVLTPATPAPRGGGLLGEFRAFASVQVWLSILVTVLGFGGMFGAFSYLAYTLTGVSGFGAGAVPWLLIVFGVGLFAGNILGGRAADRNLPVTLLSLLAGLAVVLALFALTAGHQAAAVAGLLLMGGFGFATVPGLQMRILGQATQAPTLASGANIAAFNIGNAFGAWLGGLTITAGLGYRAPLWAGAAVTLAALLVYALATRLRNGEFNRAAGELVPVTH